jgi:hypothetical protein
MKSVLGSNNSYPLQVYNPMNCEPIVMEKLPWELVASLQGSNRFIHAKQCYQILPLSMAKLRGCDNDMASYVPRKTDMVRYEPHGRGWQEWTVTSL